MKLSQCRRGAESGKAFSQAIVDRSRRPCRSGASAIELVDEHIRGLVSRRRSASLVSDCGSTPATPSEDDDRAVKHAERALHTDRESMFLGCR